MHGASSTSRLVIRGLEDLGGGRDASFFLDGTIVADTGGAGASAPAGQFWDRRATVSLTDRSLGEMCLEARFLSLRGMRLTVDRPQPASAGVSPAGQPKAM